MREKPLSLSSLALSPTTEYHSFLWLSQLNPCRRISLPVASGLQNPSSMTGGRLPVMVMSPASGAGESSTAAGLVIRFRTWFWKGSAIGARRSPLLTLSCMVQRSAAARESSFSSSTLSRASCSSRCTQRSPTLARPVRDRHALLLSLSEDLPPSGLDLLAASSAVSGPVRCPDADTMTRAPRLVVAGCPERGTTRFV